MNIVDVGYDSTHYYLLDVPGGYLMVDAGWPDTLPKLLNARKRKGVTLAQIKYVLVTHYHPDHAGLVQELKAAGARLILLDRQRAAIAAQGDAARREFIRHAVDQQTCTIAALDGIIAG